MSLLDPLRRVTPAPLQDAWGTTRWHLQRATAEVRALPDYVVLGAQRSGTTSLQRYLEAHPDVVPPLRKEVHYLDLNAHRDPAWYRGHFPTRWWLARRDGDPGHRVVTGEATPYYLFHPGVPERAARLLPDARFLVVLRDPVDRALSHHRHEVRLGWEHLPFPEALEAEDGRLAGEEARLLQDPAYVSHHHLHHAYRARGRYAEQLERWFKHVPRTRFHVVFSDVLFHDPGGTMAGVQRFLGLEAWDPGDYPVHGGSGGYDPMDPALRAELRAHYEPHDARLEKLLGRAVPWRR